MSEIRTLLPSGVEVPFSGIKEALRRSGDQTGPAPTRSLTATVVVVGPVDRLGDTADALQGLGGRSAVLAILIAAGDSGHTSVRLAGQAIALSGLKADYVNNVVAALRLSSLPTLLWFRGGSRDMLHDLSALADRLVLDEEHPFESWQIAVSLFDRTALSDLRWTRLTRWRTLMAHFFDIPRIREAARTFTHLRVRGSDRFSADLYASWLKFSLALPLHFEFQESSSEATIEDVQFGDGKQYLRLRLAASGTCVETVAVVDGHPDSTRTVSLGDRRLSALIGEELRIRARDVAFERALAACVSGR